MQLAGERIIHQLRLAIYAQLQRLSISFHQKQKVGDLVTRVTGDVDAIGEIFAKSLGQFINSFLILFIIAGYFIYKSPIYFLLAFSIAPILGFLSLWFKARVDLPPSACAARRGRSRRGAARCSGRSVRSRRSVPRSTSTNAWPRSARSAGRRGIYASKLEGRYAGLLDFTGSISAGLVLAFGTWQMSKGLLSPGELTVVVTFAKRVYRPLRTSRRRRAGSRNRSRAQTASLRSSSPTTCSRMPRTATTGPVHRARSSWIASCSATNLAGRRSKSSRCSCPRARNSL